jgi:polysaccharide biosynthesis/export protein
MQPARLGALAWCFVTSALLGTLVLAPPSRAQAVLETPQQFNDRIRAMSNAARLTQHDYVIGSGDVLAIEVFDVKELSREVRVSQTGSIGIPLVPVRLRVAGLTEVQAEQKIAEVLEANGLVSNPQVSLSVKERKSKPITVVGAVMHPMVYQADRSVTLLEVLAEAGGVANDAGDTVIISRPVRDPQEDSTEPPAINHEKSATPAVAPMASPSNSIPASAPSPKNSASASSGPPEIAPETAATAQNSAAGAFTEANPPQLNNTITVNLNELMEGGEAANNIVLQAGDIVTVPHSGVVYVLGAVSRAGGFVLSGDREKMSILKVLSLAGGTSRTAKTDHAVVVRKDTQGQQHEVPVNIKKILARQAEDLKLEPSDILYVPESAGKQAMYRALEFGVALGAGVALYRIAYH